MLLQDSVQYVAHCFERLRHAHDHDDRRQGALVPRDGHNRGDHQQSEDDGDETQAEIIAESILPPGIRRLNVSKLKIAERDDRCRDSERERELADHLGIAESGQDKQHRPLAGGVEDVAREGPGHIGAQRQATNQPVGRRVAFPVHRDAEPIDRELTALHLLAGDPLIPETGSATDAYHYVVKDLLARAPSPDEGTLLARGAAVDHKGLSLSGSAL